MDEIGTAHIRNTIGPLVLIDKFLPLVLQRWHTQTSQQLHDRHTPANHALAQAAGDAEMSDSGTLKTVKLVSGVVLILGVLLAAMMIHTESEPGAIPLALILTGGTGYIMARLKLRGASLDE